MPVSISGVVTAFSGYGNSFFVQDATDGISVDRTDNAAVSVGDTVQVTGVSSAGLFAPLVLASRVVVTGRGHPPRARPASYGDLYGGAMDSQWIELQGVVHTAKFSDLFGHETLLVTMELGGGMVKLFLQDFAGIDPASLIDSTLRVRGVCSTSFNQKRQFVGVGLFVPDRNDVLVVHPANDDPFGLPPVPVREILQFGQGQHRVKVAGISTNQVPGQSLYLQDGSDGVRVETPSRELVPPGKRVEALGFPVMGDYAPVLEDGIFRVLGDAAPVTPVKINALDVIGQRGAFNQVPYDQQLVRVQGKVMESRIQADQRVWILQQNGIVFQARLPIALSTAAMENLGTGAVLLLTGICTVKADSDRNPTSFSILLRSPQDIVVLERAPWWTPERFLALLASLAFAIVTVILWLLLLRNRVNQQTRIIRESEERFRHMAEHDGLTGMLNRGSILQAFDQELERCRREKTALTVVLADLDYFKPINDTYGHLAGDVALQRFAEAVSTCVRTYDHAGRYGGEEFLIVLTGILPAAFDDRVEEFHARISNLTVHDREREFQITCSLGAVFIEPGPEATDPHQALLIADRALYEAKEAGRNCSVCRRMKRGAPDWIEPQSQAAF